jgi:predicted metal-dependent hydrolase
VIAGKSLQGWLDRADELGAEGRYFDAHEELELAWNAAEGETKILLQGLIQIAAGLHRLRLHPEKTGGAFYLLDRGLEKLRRTSALLSPDSLSELTAALVEIRASGIPPKNLHFGLRQA